MSKPQNVFHETTYTEPKSGLAYHVEYWQDLDLPPPQEWGDCHGVVHRSICRVDDDYIADMQESGDLPEDLLMRLPAFRLLYAERGDYLYYDVIASATRAATDWGCKPEDVADVVDNDFEYLRGWYENDWSWMGITLTKLDDDGNPTDDYVTVGGYESFLTHDTAELSSILNDLAHELEYNIRAELHKNQLELPLAA